MLCREAAAKLNANREVILRDCATCSGIFTGSTGVNGEPVSISDNEQ